MKVKLAMTTILFALIMSACTEDQTYDDIQKDVRFDVKRSSQTEGSGVNGDTPDGP